MQYVELVSGHVQAIHSRIYVQINTFDSFKKWGVGQRDLARFDAIVSRGGCKLGKDIFPGQGVRQKLCWGSLECGESSCFTKDQLISSSCKCVWENIYTLIVGRMLSLWYRIYYKYRVEIKIHTLLPYTVSNFLVSIIICINKFITQAIINNTIWCILYINQNTELVVCACKLQSSRLSNLWDLKK